MVIFTILGLIRLPPLLSNPSDSTFYAVPPTLLGQIMLGASIITACIPSFKPILDAFLSGAGAVAVTAPYELSTAKLGSTIKPSNGLSFTKAFHNSTNPSANHSWIGKKLEKLGVLSSRTSAEKARGGTNSAAGNKHVEYPIELTRAEFGYSEGTVERAESITCLTDNAIVQTVTYKIEHNANPSQDAGSCSYDRASGGSRSTREGPRDGETLDFCQNI